MKPVILIVLDGYGIATPGPGNAIYLANPTFINSLIYTYPNTTLKASGEAVGLPAGEPGNTEVGHINLGAGRIVYQDLPRINMSVADGSFYSNASFLKAISHVKNANGKLHLLGLVGQGSVHSHLDHLYALLYLSKENNLENVYIHAITDGRDSPPESGLEIVNRISERLKEFKVGKIASIMGRYFAMDRDRRWERIEKAYTCLTKGVGNKFTSANEAIKSSYARGITDEFLEPALITQEDGSTVTIAEGDAVIFFNYRIDRPRELTKAFVLDNFEKDANQSLSFDPYAVKYYKTHMPQEEILTKPFSRGEKIKNLVFVTMTEYEKNLAIDIAFPPLKVKIPLGRVISDKGFNQLRITESEKERFVTYYFNGQSEIAFPLEERLIIPSPKVPTYDLKPEMSSNELTQMLLEKMRSQIYRFILVNFPNPDMVGHTGNIQATIAAIKAIDSCLTKIVNEALILNFNVLVTADHGNAEEKINLTTGDISTEHTSNVVPLIIVGSQWQGKAKKLQSGVLADVAPTVLSLMKIEKPSDMTGRNLMEELVKS